MTSYTRPRVDAPLDELRAAEDQINEAITRGDIRGSEGDVSEELNRLSRLILAAEEKADRPHRLERALAQRSPETPFPEGI